MMNGLKNINCNIMVKIFNKKLDKEIIFPDNDNIQESPKFYDEDNPHIKLEIKCTLNNSWMRHAQTCEECGSLFKSFGSNSRDWFLEYNQETYQMDLSTLGQNYKDNKIQDICSYYFTGSILQFNVKDKETLKKELENQEIDENYEECKLILESIKIMND